ncbi:hypothetical protein F5Y18DRAFT_94721 [Xylariaceae sp. FL1019]|nr:hypothetical protein F5Y18DRAFT_94721 [Xylariaceae sp. FL1019]
MAQFIGESHETMPKQFLKNCVIAVAGDLNDPGDNRWDDEKVRRWVSTYGGTFSTTVGPNVTHLLCTESDAKKKTTRIKDVLQQKDTALVTRYWLEDCIARKSLIKVKNSDYDLKAELAAEKAKKRKLEKDAKSSALAENYVDERFYRVYHDVTYFEYQVTLTLNDPEAGHEGQRYVLTLWESNAKPYLYVLTSLLYNKTRAKPDKWRATAAPTSFERSFGIFKRFFKKKTGIEWDERLEKTNGSGKFKYSPPTRGKTVGLVNGRLATDISDSPSVKSYYDAALSNTSETEQQFEEDDESSEPPAKRARLVTEEAGRHSRRGTLSTTTSLAHRSESGNSRDEFATPRTPMRQEATTEGQLNDTSITDSLPPCSHDDAQSTDINQNESLSQITDVDINRSPGSTAAASLHERNVPSSTFDVDNDSADLFGTMEDNPVLDSCEPQFHDANIGSSESYPPTLEQPPDASCAEFGVDKFDQNMEDILAHMQEIPVVAPLEQQVQNTFADITPASEATGVVLPSPSPPPPPPTFDHMQDLDNLFNSMEDGNGLDTFEAPVQDTNAGWNEYYQGIEPSQQDTDVDFSQYYQGLELSHHNKNVDLSEYHQSFEPSQQDADMDLSKYYQGLQPTQQQGSGNALSPSDETDMKAWWDSILAAPVGELDVWHAQGINAETAQPYGVLEPVPHPQEQQNYLLPTLNNNDEDNLSGLVEQLPVVEAEEPQIENEISNIEYPLEPTQGDSLPRQLNVEKDADEPDGDLESLFGAEADDVAEQYQHETEEASIDSYHPDNYAHTDMQQDHLTIEHETSIADESWGDLFGALDDDQVEQVQDPMTQDVNFDFHHATESTQRDIHQVEPHPEPEVLGMEEWMDNFLSQTDSSDAYQQGDAVTPEGDTQREPEASLADAGTIDGEHPIVDNGAGNPLNSTDENDGIVPAESKSERLNDDLAQVFEDVGSVEAQPDVPLDASHLHTQQPIAQSPDIEESHMQQSEVQELDPQLLADYHLELQQAEMEDVEEAQLESSDFKHVSLSPQSPDPLASPSSSYARSTNSDIKPVADQGPEVRAAGLVALSIYREHHRGVLMSNDNEGALIDAVLAEIAEEKARLDAEKEEESEEEFTWEDCLAEHLGGSE